MAEIRSDARRRSRRARRQAHLFHPNTNLAAFHKSTPLVLARGEGHARLGQPRQALHRGDGRALVHDARLRRRGARVGRVRADQEAVVHASVHGQESRARRSCSRTSSSAWRRSRRTRVFFGNSGSDANDTQIKLAWYYNNARGRPQKKKIIARQKAYHGTTLASAGLTGLPVVPQELRRAAAGHPAHGRAVLLPRRGARRVGGGLRDAAREQSRAAHRARGSRHDRRVLRGAADGRRRRAAAAAHVLREDPGRAREARHPADRRRGDHGLRPHRRALGRAGVRDEARAR